jgi:G3E family GTPase
MRRIPVVVVAGFLGSGKTTLLNHLLAHSRDARIAVVVNDFGAVGIDSLLVSGSGGTISLDNGCLCCAVGEDGVGPLLDRLVRDDIDVIVIEASGIAEPGTLVQLVLAAANPNLVFGGLVEVVDAMEFEALLRRHPTVEKHVGLADLLVLNKVDRADPGKVWRVRRLLRELNDAAPIVPATHSDVDPRLLFDITIVPGRQLMLGEASDHPGGHSGHLHAAYDSVSFTSDEPLDPQRLRDLIDRRPAGVYRIKGVVAFGVPGHRQRYVLHTVGRYVRFRRTRWGTGEPRRTSLVLIGAGIDTAAIRTELAACVADADSRTDADAMLPVLRYTFGG